MEGDVTVALVAGAAAVAGGIVTAIAAFFTRRYELKRVTEQARDQYLVERDKTLWEQAGDFWDKRAADLTNSLQLEREAREAETTALKAELALKTLDISALRKRSDDCDERATGLERRLVKAAQDLQSSGAS